MADDSSLVNFDRVERRGSVGHWSEQLAVCARLCFSSRRGEEALTAPDREFRALSRTHMPSDGFSREYSHPPNKSRGREVIADQTVEHREEATLFTFKQSRHARPMTHTPTAHNRYLISRLCRHSSFFFLFFFSPLIECLSRV